MPTLVSGTLTYDHPSNYIKIDVFDRIATYDPEATPLLAVLTRLNKKRGRDIVVRWFEDELVPRWGLVSATTAATTAATTINMATAADAALFEPGGAAGVLAYNPATGEQILVTAVVAAALTVTKGYGDVSTADTVAVSASLLVLGRIDLENKTSVTPLLTQPTEKTNVMQIFKDSWAASGSEMETEKWVDNDRDYKLKKLGRDHAVNIERSLWFAKKKTGAAATVRAMDGITRYITTNVVSMTQVLDQDDVDEALTLMARHTQGQNKNVFFFGPGKFVQAMAKIAKTNLQTFPAKDSEFGFRYSTYIGPHFDATLVTHWLMEASGLSTSDTTLQRRAYALNMDFLMYRPLGKRDTTLRMQIQENDRDGEKDEYLTECTIQFMLEKAHSKLSSTVAFV